MLNRRTVMAGAVALPIAAALPAIPAALAEAVADAPRIDRAAFANRLHLWAMHVPQMGDRIDAMLADVEPILSTGEGMEPLLEAIDVCEERNSRTISLDWIIGGDGCYRSGQERRMWLDEDGDSADDAQAEIRAYIHESDPTQLGVFSMVIGAIKERDYRNARAWAEWGYQQAGITIEQW